MAYSTKKSKKVESKTFIYVIHKYHYINAADKNTLKVGRSVASIQKTFLKKLKNTATKQ